MVKLTFKSIKSAYKHCVLEDNCTFYFRFKQTNDKLNKVNFEEKEMVQKQGDYYVIQGESRNEIYYIKDGFILQLEGNIGVAELVAIMEQVDSYKNVELQY